MCPLEPVIGIEKLTICAAKTNAPIIPISGMSSESKRAEAAFVAKSSKPSETNSIATPVFAETSASDICIANIYSIFFVFCFLFFIFCG